MPSILSSNPFTQAPIPEPPKVISTKDLSYLKDALSWELIAFKKLHAFAQQATDPQVKQCLEQQGQMHQRHYQKLLSHLQNNNTAVMATIPQIQSQQQQQQSQPQHQMQ
ncbi:ferritin-like domain-containing protein [Brevibacillus formosus]|uniref:ferritin-like domain-containing protein n=1 Tax=Brevibacillus formosus TaxID=54913 RepID=UPI003F1DCCA9